MLEQPSGSNAVTKIRAVFRDKQQPLTITNIREALPELKPSQISMTLCYLLRTKYVVREQIENPRPKERHKVWQYTYSDQRFLGVNDANRTSLD
mgnify:CR=1 FL=1